MLALLRGYKITTFMKFRIANASLGAEALQMLQNCSSQNLFGPIDTGSGTAISEQEIKKLPVRSANDIASLGAGTYQEDSGDVFQIRGSRTGATRLMVDGNYVDDFNSIPNSAIQEMQVLTGGIPAKYGDTTGGVVIITTKSYRFY